MKNLLLKFLILVLLFSATRIGVTNAFYSDTQILASNHLETSCWVAPDFGSWLGPVDNTTTSNEVDFVWPEASTTCPVAQINYRLQIFTNSGLTNLYMEYGWTGSHNFVVTDIAQGNYWWKVLATDQYGNRGTSSTFLLTVDRTSPSASLSITGSWTKLVQEKVVNGDFRDGLAGWTTAGDVSLLTSDTVKYNDTFPVYFVVRPPNVSSNMVRIGQQSYPSDEGKFIWENRLMQSFEGGAKSLTIDYDFVSRDYGSHDDPGFLVRLNGQDIFNLTDLSISPDGDGSAHSSGWRRFYYDLSSYTANDKLNLAIYSGNTGDTSYQSWAYISKVSTYFVAAPAHAVYTIWGSDVIPGSAINYCEYKIDGANWQTGNNFSVPTSGSHTIAYRCIDNAGNSSPISVVTVITDTTAPSLVDSLSAYMTKNSALLTWTATGNDGDFGRASAYDVRYSTSEITAENFDSATKVDRVGAPKDPGTVETLEILGLNPNTNYWFAMKTADEAPNWSEISNVVSDKTPTSEALINEGDVIINEIMWSGADQFIELRNMTDHIATVSGFKIAGLTLPTNSEILPHGYFVIDSGLNLSSESLDLRLLDNGDNEIDRAGNGGTPFAGGGSQSMERTLVPGNGASPLSWYSCLDGNTKGVENRSDNEPITGQSGASPSAILRMSDDKKSLSFSINNSDLFVSSSYEITYDTDLAPQGVMGKGASAVIVLGTCSTGGTCVYHTGVKNIHLKVSLLDKDNKEVLLEKDLP